MSVTIDIFNVLESHLAVTIELLRPRMVRDRSPRTVKYAFHVEAHNFVPPIILRNRVKWCTPRSTGVVNKDMEFGLLGFERIGEGITTGFTLYNSGWSPP
jgi:hypothetical protein